MKTLELKPTHENIINAFVRNPIGRNGDVFMFADILNSIDSNCSISLDGGWGRGKTFFVKQAKAFLDSQNDFVKSISADDKELIVSEWKSLHKGKEPEYMAQVSVYYDAWENDNDEDPILSLIYSILKNVNDDFSMPNDADFFDLTASIIEFFTGKNWKSLIDSFRSEDPLDSLRKAKAIQDHIKKFLDSLLEERGDRLVIFVDELDRCKPSFAVQLLERIKHYFTNDRITFVFSINTSELQHTIKKHYGDGFDACRYLDRFFDIPVVLPPANMTGFFNSIGLREQSYYYEIVCKAVIERYNLSLREIARYVQLTKIAAYEPTHDSDRFSFAFPSGRAVHFSLIYVVPIMIGLRLVDMERYQQFIAGKNYEPLMEFKDIFRVDYFERFLNKDETYDIPVEGKKVVTAEEKLQAIYSALFATQYSGTIRHITLGEYQFSQETRDVLMRTVSLFSDYATFNDE